MGTWTPSTGHAPRTAAPLVESVKGAGRRRTPGMVLTPVKRRKLLAANMTLEIKKAPDILRMPSVSVEVLNRRNAMMTDSVKVFDSKTHHSSCTRVKHHNKREPCATEQDGWGDTGT